MTRTIRIDKTTNTLDGKTLYVSEQLNYDVLDGVSWRAVHEADSSFAAPMRHDYILIHDKEVGVLIPAQLAMAVYRFTRHTVGRKMDIYGNTVVYAETKRLVERLVPAAELVNIDYVARTRNVPRAKLPALKVDREDVQLQDTRQSRKRERYGYRNVHPETAVSLPNAGQRARLAEYQELVESGLDGRIAHARVYGKPTGQDVAEARAAQRTRRLLAE